MKSKQVYAIIEEMNSYGTITLQDMALSYHEPKEVKEYALSLIERRSFTDGYDEGMRDGGR